MLHVLSDPLQEAQGLIEGNWHRDLGQLLEGARRHLVGFLGLLGMPQTQASTPLQVLWDHIPEPPTSIQTRS